MFVNSLNYIYFYQILSDLDKMSFNHYFITPTISIYFLIRSYLFRIDSNYLIDDSVIYLR